MSSLWTGAKVRLRGIEPEDWEGFMAFDQHTRDMRAVDRVHPPRSAAGYRQWTVDEAARETAADQLHLAIESLEDEVLVGSLSTSAVDRRAGRFAYGIGIGHEHQRRGYAADAVGLLLAFMFGEQRFTKCEAGVYDFNTASIALHRALGFTQEGRLREHEYFAGAHHDLVLFGLTAREFAERRPFEDVSADG